MSQSANRAKMANARPGVSSASLAQKSPAAATKPPALNYLKVFLTLLELFMFRFCTLFCGEFFKFSTFDLNLVQLDILRNVTIQFLKLLANEGNFFVVFGQALSFNETMQTRNTRIRRRSMSVSSQDSYSSGYILLCFHCTLSELYTIKQQKNLVPRVRIPGTFQG